MHTHSRAHATVARSNSLLQVGLYDDLYMYDLFRPCGTLCWLGEGGEAGVVLAAAASDAAGHSELTHVQLPGNLGADRTPVHDRRDFAILSVASCRCEVHYVRALGGGSGSGGVGCPAGVLVAGTTASHNPRLDLWRLPPPGVGVQQGDDPGCLEIPCPPSTSPPAVPTAGREACLLIDSVAGVDGLVVAASPGNHGLWEADVCRLGPKDTRGGGLPWTVITHADTESDHGGREPLVAIKAGPGDRCPHSVLTVDRNGIISEWDRREAHHRSSHSRGGHGDTGVSRKGAGLGRSPVHGFDVREDLALCVRADATLEVTDLRRRDRPLTVVALGGGSETASSSPRRIRYEVHMSPPPWHVASVSGFADGTVRLFDLQRLAAAAGGGEGCQHPPPLFQHRGHEVEYASFLADASPQEGVTQPPPPLRVTHSWHPHRGTTVLSADHRGGLHAWVAALPEHDLLPPSA